MFCNYCGKKNIKNFVYCSYCGKKRTTGIANGKKSIKSKTAVEQEFKELQNSNAKITKTVNKIGETNRRKKLHRNGK